MIDTVTLTNFKCHGNTNIRLKNLNLLLGTNSSGKSTILQGILLAVHNISNPEASPLNGHLVSIGSFQEARNFVTNAKDFVVKITSNHEAEVIRFHRDDEDDYSGKVNIIERSNHIEALLNYSNKNIHYLSAHRIGGQDLYSKNFDNYDLFGINGEYAIDYLEHNSGRPVESDLIQYKESETLEAQVNYWLRRIVNHSVSTEQIQGTDKVKAEFYQMPQRHLRPKNTGSGVSYLLSILIVCLSSKKGDIILVENPEIHLHPRAQSSLVDFFVLIANAGIQLVIETHSDHIFNGIRVNIFQKKIAVSSAAMHFFTLDETYQTHHSLISITENGRIENPQHLLFDQFDSDLDKLLGI